MDHRRERVDDRLLLRVVGRAFDAGAPVRLLLSGRSSGVRGPVWVVLQAAATGRVLLPSGPWGPTMNVPGLL